MNKTQFKNEHLTLEVTAHEDAEGRLLMVSATAAERESAEPEPAANLAIVIDRSGSMSGQKLEIAKTAAARLVESLREIDRVAVVAFDDEVDVVSTKIEPSKGLARLIQGIRSGGSTNLYGGWLEGARLLKGPGRVLLLSDGQANAGRYADAATLAEHARKSLRQYGVSTSTVGVGQDYDERLMAGMAREGGGFHYFAHTAEAILEAFTRERFLMASLAVADAQLELGGQVIQIGQLLEGETKVVVTRIDALPATAKLTYLDAKTEHRVAAEIALPQEFSEDLLATAYWIVERASQLFDRSGDVHSSGDAERLRDETRQLMLEAGNHPLADEEPLKSTCHQLQASIDRLADLARNYDEPEAQMHRKRSMQGSFNARERGKAYSSFHEDALILRSSVAHAHAPRMSHGTDLAAFGVRPPEFWLQIPAVPLELRNGFVVVGLVDPMDGFVVGQLEKDLGLKVRTDKRPWTREEIEEAIRAAN